MPHIHTKAGQHDLSSSAFIIRIDGSEPKVLLHVHKKLHRLLAVGGHVELHETPWQCILHEVEEEAGYIPEQLEVLQPVERIKQLKNVTLHPYPLQLQTHRFSDDLDHYHTDFSYVFVTREAPAKVPDEGESQDIRWYTLKELQDLDNLTPDILQIVEFCIITALKNWEKVPTHEFAR